MIWFLSQVYLESSVMKKTISILFIVSSFTFAHAGEYVKPNGSMSLSAKNGFADFSINASRGDASGVCNMEGVAESVGAGAEQRNRWVYSDSSSTCVAVISELKDRTVNVMTRSCESYCGVSAVGSMDGKYRKE